MRLQIAAYAILVLAIAGCSGSRGTYEPYPKPKDPVATKISISGNSFVQYSTFGLFVCRHEDQAANPDNLEFVEHNVGYNNIKVTKTATAWSFYNQILGLDLSKLYLSTAEGNYTADVYAYAPHIEGVSSPDSIAFDVNSNHDLMYVAENLDKNVNKDLQPGVDADGQLTLTFRHVMARLRFGMRIKNTSPVSVHTVDSIVVRKSGAAHTELYKTGVLNAITGEVLPQTTSDSVSVKRFFFNSNGSGSFNSGTYKYFDMMIFPVEYQSDGDYEVVIVVDGFRKVFPIRRADVMHSDGTTCGFLASNSYVFNITIDNYIHMDGVEIKTDWEEEELSDEI